MVRLLEEIYNSKSTDITIQYQVWKHKQHKNNGQVRRVFPAEVPFYIKQINMNRVTSKFYILLPCYNILLGEVRDVGYARLNFFPLNEFF